VLIARVTKRLRSRIELLHAHRRGRTRTGSRFRGAHQFPSHAPPRP